MYSDMDDRIKYSSKVCFKCNVSQPLSCFYKHEQMADGHLNKCKECTKKDTKENILKNHEYYLQYDKNRANLPHRVEARNAYSKTDAGKISAQKAKEKYISTNIVKRSAHIILGNAIRDKLITKQYVCSECGVDNVRIHGHHDDYNYPLVVRWLCAKCHSKWHKINGPGLNG